MRRAAATAGLAGALAALAGAPGPAAAHASSALVPGPRVTVLVAGRSAVLKPPTAVVARPATIAVGSRRCAVAGGTPLAALEGVRRLRGPSYAVRDYGSCSARASDAASLYVFRVGADLARARDGWVYKVGRRAGSAGAADPRGPFRTGVRLRSGQRLTWFYCRTGPAGCQLTLELAVAPRVAAGAAVAVSVRGYDDFGRGRPVAGALVRLGASSGQTGLDGSVTLTAPAGRGRAVVSATAPGLVPAFPVAVTVG